VKGMPTSFVIDRMGHIRSRRQGFLLRDREALENLVRSLIAAPQSPDSGE
jgi:hypothetical protein